MAVRFLSQLQATLASASPAASRGVEAESVSAATNVPTSAAPNVPANSPPNTAIAAAQVQSMATAATVSPSAANAPVLEKVATLQDASNDPPTPTVVVDLALTDAQSQIAQTFEKTGLASSPIPHTSVAAFSLSSSDIRATEAASTATQAADASQSLAAATNNQSSLQNSSSDHGGKKDGDSSVSSDLSSSLPLPAKNESCTFSEALSAATIVKTSAAQVPQALAIAQPALGAPPPLSDLSTRSGAEPALAQQPLPAMQISDASSGRFVNSAQLINAASQSEMHIAMQTNKLGAIEIHARMSGDEIGAAIIVDKREAHAALAVELPALQQALSDKQLRVAPVALTQGSLGAATGDAGANAQQHQRGSSRPAQSASFWNEARSLSTAAWFVTEQTGAFNAQGRLSVQA